MPLILFEAQDKVSLALRKEMLRRRGLIVEPRVRLAGVDMPQSLDDALRAHLEEVTLPPVEAPEQGGMSVERTAQLSHSSPRKIWKLPP
jgi:4-hydroxy-tetrahydrodipicolinate synthase